jgi:predicted nuclease of predicted toxin-antitoxin system
MKLKLDENFDVRLAPLLAGAGHDVDTVATERLGGSKDDAIFAACCAGGRALVTMDLDFAHPLRFPPGATEGILVVRPHHNSLAAIRAALVGLLPHLKAEDVKGKLWIVEPGRIRVYEP